MSEKCPIAGGQHSGVIDEIPGFCLKNCQVLWDDAVKNVAPEYDPYKPSTADCNHESHDVENSHQSLQSLDDSPKRVYSTVDMCGGCSEELGENLYTFSCPYN